MAIMAHSTGSIPAVYPWFSLDASRIMRYTEDSPEQIERCLHCEYSECCDCIAGGKPTKMGRPSKTTVEIISAHLKSGKSVSEISVILGVSRQTIFNYKKKIIEEDNIA